MFIALAALMVGIACYNAISLSRSMTPSKRIVYVSLCLLFAVFSAIAAYFHTGSRANVFGLVAATLLLLVVTATVIWREDINRSSDRSKSRQ